MHKRLIYKGNWMQLESVTIRNKTGIETEWEFASRAGNAKAVVMLAVLHPSERLLVIREYRPAVGSFVIALPAGLFTDNEDICMAALRELKEETGYTGTIYADDLKETPYSTTSSPGMTDETIYFVRVDVDETLNVNKLPKQELEENEDIEVFTVEHTKPSLTAFLKDRIIRGDAIDSRFAAYVLGVQK